MSISANLIQHGWKYLFGASALVASVGFTAQALRPANASMPVGMQWGDFPIQSFSHHDGTAPTPGSSMTADLLTVPSDRIFVVTTVIANNYTCQLYVDGSLKRGSENLFHYNNEKTNAFIVGNAHLVVPAGSTLQLYGYYGTCYIEHLEGYYAHVPS